MWQDWFFRRRRKPPSTAAQDNDERTRASGRQRLTLRFHAETAQTASRMQSTSADVDWSRQPSIYKVYPSAARLPLTEQIDCTFPDTLDVLQHWWPRPADAQPRAAWNVETLSRLCYYAYGPTAQQTLPGATLTLRAAPSAGALYPAELYVAVRGATGARNGVYHYAPGEHALELLRPADWLAWLADAAADWPAVAEADAVFAISSVWWRTAWKYGARAYRYCLQDCGHLAGNVALVAAALGHTATVVYYFMDEPVNRLVGLSSPQERVQVLVAVHGAPNHLPLRGVLDAPAPLMLESSLPIPQSAAVDAILPAANAAELHTPAEVQTMRRCVAPPVSETPASERPQITPLPRVRPTAPVSLCQSLLGRRSSHQFKPAPVPKETFSAILQALQVTHLSDSAQSALEFYVIVNRIEGVPEGAYRYDPVAPGLALVRAGNLSEWAMHLSLDQAFCGQAGAVIFFAANLNALVQQCGDRMYRQLHLEAGLRAEVAYLAAHALGVGCTGIGAFYDLETVRFFNLSDTTAIIYELAIGVPA